MKKKFLTILVFGMVLSISGCGKNIETSTENIESQIEEAEVLETAEETKEEMVAEIKEEMVVELKDTLTTTEVYDIIHDTFTYNKWQGQEFKVSGYFYPRLGSYGSATYLFEYENKTNIKDFDDLDKSTYIYISEYDIPTECYEDYLKTMKGDYIEILAEFSKTDSERTDNRKVVIKKISVVKKGENNPEFEERVLEQIDDIIEKAEEGSRETYKLDYAKLVNIASKNPQFLCDLSFWPDPELNIRNVGFDAYIYDMKWSPYTHEFTLYLTPEYVSHTVPIEEVEYMTLSMWSELDTLDECNIIPGSKIHVVDNFKNYYFTWEGINKHMNPVDTGNISEEDRQYWTEIYTEFEKLLDHYGN